MSSSADVQRIVAQVVERFGGIDILVNNAGMTDHKNVLELDEAEWDRVLAVGLDYIPERRQVKNLLGRPGVPEDVATAVLYLASADGDFITAAHLLVDGGALAGGNPFSAPAPLGALERSA